MRQNAHPHPETESLAEAQGERGPILIGLGMVLVYLAVALFYRESPHPFHAVIRELFIWPVVLALLFLYKRGFDQVKQVGNWRIGWGMGFCLLVLAAILLWIQPFHSRDIYGYINRGWQQYYYGLNPYVSVIGDIPNWGQDPMLTDHWIGNPSPYGFLFLLWTKVTVMLGQGKLVQSMLGIKFFNILVHGCIGWLVWSGAKRLRLKRPDLALYLYLFNPLILMHHLAIGHNDILMAFFMMLAVYFALLGAWLLVIPAILAAAMMKYAVIITLPFAWILIAKQRGRWVALASLILGGGTVLLAALPYIGDWREFQLGLMGSNAMEIQSSLFSVFVYSSRFLAATLPFLAWLEQESLWAGIRSLFFLSLLVFIGMKSVQMLRSPEVSINRFLFNAVLAQFLLICVVSPKFYPWYIGMFFPMGLLLPEDNWLRRLVILVSGFELLAFTFVGKAHVLNYLLMIGVPVLWIGRQKLAKQCLRFYRAFIHPKRKHNPATPLENPLV